MRVGKRGLDGLGAVEGVNLKMVGCWVKSYDRDDGV